MRAIFKAIFSQVELSLATGRVYTFQSCCIAHALHTFRFPHRITDEYHTDNLSHSVVSENVPAASCKNAVVYQFDIARPRRRKHAHAFVLNTHDDNDDDDKGTRTSVADALLWLCCVLCLCVCRTDVGHRNCVVVHLNTINRIVL